jgi:TPR repeat protein
MSGNAENCPFCKADHVKKTDVERVGELMKRVEVNDAGAMYILGSYYFHGQLGLNQDREKALELWTRAAKLGSSQAHFALGCTYNEGVDSKKSKFHYEAAAMAGHEVARNNLGCKEYESGNMERVIKHWLIAASAGEHSALNNLLISFNQGLVSRNTINSTLTAYNSSCAEMRSEARDAYLRAFLE